MKGICSKCGMPTNIGRTNVWQSNGVIVGKYPPHLRGTIYDLDEIKYLFESISRQTGLDISRLIIEGKRKDALRFISSMLQHFREVGGGTLPPPRNIYEIIFNLCKIWGLGAVEILNYQEGETIAIPAKNAYFLPMFAGDAAGVYESIEGYRVIPLWEGDESELTLTLKRGEGEPELEERIEAEVERGIPSREGGDLWYKLCGECSAPLELSRLLSWDLENALITEKLTGNRAFFHNANGLFAVVKLLVEELGEDIERIILSSERVFAKNLYTRVRGATSLDAELNKFPLRSWGRPSHIKKEGGSFIIQVDNPYLDHLVAGRIWGLYEAFNQQEYIFGLESSGSGFIKIELDPLSA